VVEGYSGHRGISEIVRYVSPKVFRGIFVYGDRIGIYPIGICMNVLYGGGLSMGHRK
jgi:hypothetical protein